MAGTKFALGADFFCQSGERENHPRRHIRKVRTMRAQVIEEGFVLLIEHQRIESTAQRSVLENRAQALGIEEDADVAGGIIAQTASAIHFDGESIRVQALRADQTAYITGRKRHFGRFTAA